MAIRERIIYEMCFLADKRDGKHQHFWGATHFVGLLYCIHWNPPATKHGRCHFKGSDFLPSQSPFLPSLDNEYTRPRCERPELLQNDCYSSVCNPGRHPPPPGRIRLIPPAHIFFTVWPGHISTKRMHHYLMHLHLNLKTTYDTLFWGCEHF